MSLLNLVAFVAFATSLFTRSTDPIVPQIADAFTVAPETAALLASAFALPYAFVQPVLGALADMFSKTRLMTACLLILVAASTVAVFAPNFETMIVSRMISGIAAGGVFPIALAIAGDRVAVDQRQIAISRLLGAAMMGSLLGASGAGVLADLFGWRSVFVATALIGFVILIAAVRGFRNVEDHAPGKFDLSTLGPNYRAIFGNPLSGYCFGLVFLESLCIFGIFPHMANLLQQGGETLATTAGVVLAGFGFGALLYTFAVSRLLNWFDARTMMVIGGTTMALCLAVISLRLAWQYELANFILLGFGMYFLHGFIQVVATELAPSARGSAMALHSAFFFFGQAAGPYLYGRGFTILGVAPTLLIAAAVMLIVGIVAAFKLRQPSRGVPAL
jgi:predicted MFS family arabinose efflux permease